MDILNDLHRLEIALASASSRRDRDQLELVLADDFVEFGASGNIWSRDQVLEDLPSEVPAERVLGDFQVRPLAENTVLVTYRCSTKSLASDRGVFSLRSSLWQHRGGRWQMIFHQGTNVAEG
jgi:hypothetical protein